VQKVKMKFQGEMNATGGLGLMLYLEGTMLKTRDPPTFEFEDEDVVPKHVFRSKHLVLITMNCHSDGKT
jgi:hypothetical protein